MNKKEIQKQIDSLQEQLDNLKEDKFEVGKWYRSVRHPKGIYCVKNTENKECYGFDLVGTWGNEWRLGTLEIRPATDEEVKEALIKEAKRRGFKEGVRFKSAWNGEEFVFSEKRGYTQLDDTNLCNMGNGSVFYDGRWAEIIEDKLELNGKEVTIDRSKNVIKIGCRKYALDWIEDTLKSLDVENIVSIEHEEVGTIYISHLKDILNK